ncbi:MAG: HupE/UreJ family protein [Rhodothermus sp.]|nr:HupE/UreJ family protein [Rhodothermus sp.]
MKQRFALRAVLQRGLPMLLATLPMSVLAHTGLMPSDSLGHGLLHPLTGLDHLLAALGVGLWATVQPKASGRWLPAVFLGAVLIGLPLGAFWSTPATESGILMSVLLLGAALTLLLRVPKAIGLPLVALIGLVHGHVHGTELLPGAGLSYASGLLLATAVLVLLGYASGQLLHHRQRIGTLRYAGIALLLFGLFA